MREIGVERFQVGMRPSARASSSRMRTSASVPCGARFEAPDHFLPARFRRLVQVHDGLGAGFGPVGFDRAVQLRLIGTEAFSQRRQEGAPPSVSSFCQTHRISVASATPDASPRPLNRPEQRRDIDAAGGVTLAALYPQQRPPAVGDGNHQVAEK